MGDLLSKVLVRAPFLAMIRRGNPSSRLDVRWEVTKLDPRVFLVNNTALLRAMFSAALATCRWD